jgi:ATP-dependent helicase HepA
MSDQFRPGQRWISESEPELGLGTIIRLAPRTVVTEFKAAAQTREYARNNAPLRRVRFRVGDAIENRTRQHLSIESIDERDGILYYRGGQKEFCETDLSDTISFNKPEERLFAGQFDRPEAFDLRVAALEHQHRRRKSKVRGFLGGRIDLIPHQLYIASEVAGRMAPRVLLADEVGLGKTIEACLILHRLILTGRVQRAIILVPDSLVHQWFVELLRRFNLWFHIYDAERCDASGDANPFLEAQLVLCSMRLLTTDERRSEEALNAGWDMLVIDEAHHLQWSPGNASPEYQIVEKLGRRTAGLLLLTATPEQLGMASHFARLRLLDPDRFYDLDAFLREANQYREAARKAVTLEEGPELNALLDRHGTGRVQFRNTRATVSGFPRRIVHLHPITPNRSKDPRIDWLTELLKTTAPEKILLICRTRQTVASIEIGLRKRIRIELGVFHEELTLIQRDRNAAWFGQEDGARILLCSEIGSEGRNFQFAHHLVLYDLPVDPELLEQRIGRLDRIGQRSEIHIHVPFVRDSFQEVLALWHHEGLDSFQNQPRGGREMLERFGDRVNAVKSREELSALIDETRAAHREIAARLHDGRDRLLELNSLRPDAAAVVVDEIRREDRDTTLESFMLSVFDFFSIHVEEIAERTYKLGSAGVLADAFPGLPASGFTVTCERERALLREDVQFLTWDHPLVTGALDLLLGSEKGNSSAIQGNGQTSLDAIFVLECIAPPQLHVDRFLPPMPIRVSVEGPNIEDVEDIDEMLGEARRRANEQVPELVKRARREMTVQLTAEITRLRELQKVNPSVRDEEIRLLQDQQQELEDHFNNARLRLDALRLRMARQTLE